MMCRQPSTHDETPPDGPKASNGHFIKRECLAAPKKYHGCACIFSTGRHLKNYRIEMIISANRTYFAPYPGFFYKAHLSDYLVILDDVQFPRKTIWITRNRIKNDQGTVFNRCHHMIAYFIYTMRSFS